MTASDTHAQDNALTPRNTRLLLGHEKAERLFLEAVNQERIHHGWLITGPRGIGKATFAWRMAKFLLAKNPGADAGGGLFGDALPRSSYETLSLPADDSTAKRVEAGGHGGILHISRSENESTGKLRNDIVVADVRRLSTFFGQTASEGGWRVAIIDAADELNVNAANALLKILEEPPERSILILIAHSPGRLLPTITSRCRQLALAPLSAPTLKAVLVSRYPDLSTEVLDALVAVADGAPGMAVEMHENGGIAVQKELMDLLSTLPHMNMTAVHGAAVRYGGVKADSEYRLFTRLFTDWLMRTIRTHALGQGASGPDMGQNSAYGGAVRVDQWLDLWEKVDRLIIRADAVNLDRKQVIVSMFAALRATVQA